MTKEAPRRCSHCGHNGHNSRTCKGCSSIKLFGVKINVFDDNHGGHDSIRRTKSMGSLQQALNSSSANNGDHGGAVDSGYLSEDNVKAKKRGTTWTEEEHRNFLIGLEKVGKGDWRGISRTYVPSRTPTQVASHAQKYFIRIGCNDKRKRRTSVFDKGAKGMNQEKDPLEMASQPLNKTDKKGKGKATETTPERLIPFCKHFSVLNPAYYEKPPLSPVSPLAVPSFNSMSDMNHSVAKVVPTMFWAYRNQGYGYLGNLHENYASYGQFKWTWDELGSANSVVPRQMPAGVLPQAAAPPAQATKKDALDLSIGALSL